MPAILSNTDLSIRRFCCDFVFTLGMNDSTTQRNVSRKMSYTILESIAPFLTYCFLRAQLSLFRVEVMTSK